jgi:hypothetical protein
MPHDSTLFVSVKLRNRVAWLRWAGLYSGNHKSNLPPLCSLKIEKPGAASFSRCIHAPKL